MRAILFFFAFVLLVSCNNSEKSVKNQSLKAMIKNEFNHSNTMLNYGDSIRKEVNIVGKIKNFDKRYTDLKLTINRIALDNIVLYTKADMFGNFSFSFESYISTDVWIKYKKSFLVLTHPGDSIYIEFDGRTNKKEELLESVVYNGDTKKSNTDAAQFQFYYETSGLKAQLSSRSYQVKNYETDEFVSYLDSLRTRIDKEYQTFISKVEPNKEVTVWVKQMLYEDYYDLVELYPINHQSMNGLPRKGWSMPEHYFDEYLGNSIIENEMLLCGYALKSYIGWFKGYVREKLFREPENIKYQLANGRVGGNKDIMDSLSILQYFKYAPDNIIRQMVLSEHFNQYLDRLDIEHFEKYRYVLDEYITAPFLRNPLLEKYEQKKQQIENPQLTNIGYEKQGLSSADEVYESILEKNKGKVIYLDCWATWCGSCKAEMPNSKLLMEKLKDKDVAFVFTCIDSKELKWKACLSELKIGGQHHFLTNEQSFDFKKRFEIQGVPCYFLIDKKGVIIDKGFHLIPEYAKSKIEKLLEK